MTIYEAFNWIKEAEYTPCGYIIFNENKPEGQMKGKALKTIFEAAKKEELVPLELFNHIKKERDDLNKRLDELNKTQRFNISDELCEQINQARETICNDFCKYTSNEYKGYLTQKELDEICEKDCPLSKL